MISAESSVKRGDSWKENFHVNVGVQDWMKICSDLNIRIIKLICFRTKFIATIYFVVVNFLYREFRHTWFHMSWVMPLIWLMTDSVKKLITWLVETETGPTWYLHIMLVKECAWWRLMLVVQWRAILSNTWVAHIAVPCKRLVEL